MTEAVLTFVAMVLSFAFLTLMGVPTEGAAGMVLAVLAVSVAAAVAI